MGKLIKIEKETRETVRCRKTDENIGLQFCSICPSHTLRVGFIECDYFNRSNYDQFHINRIKDILRPYPATTILNRDTSRTFTLINTRQKIENIISSLFEIGILPVSPSDKEVYDKLNQLFPEGHED